MSIGRHSFYLVRVLDQKLHRGIMRGSSLICWRSYYCNPFHERLRAIKLVITGILCSYKQVLRSMQLKDSCLLGMRLIRLILYAWCWDRLSILCDWLYALTRSSCAMGTVRDIMQLKYWRDWVSHCVRLNLVGQYSIWSKISSLDNLFLLNVWPTMAGCTLSDLSSWESTKPFL